MTAVWLIMIALLAILESVYEPDVSRPSRSYRMDGHCKARSWVIRTLPPEISLRMR